MRFLKQLKNFVLILFLCCSAHLQAQILPQGKGKAVIYFEPATTVIVKLDSMPFKPVKNPILLKTGTHIVKAWAPTKKLFIDTITVTESTTAISAKALENSDAYNAYRKDLKDYRLKRIGADYAPLSLTLIYAAIAYGTYEKNLKQINNHYANAEAEKAGYETAISVSNISRRKNTYYSEKASYEKYINKNNTLVTVSEIVIPAAILGSAALLFFTRHLKKPVYTEQRLLSLNNISVQGFEKNYCLSLAFTLNPR